ncbi:hypothetical protein J6590_092423 [Homalodisca vitripennis]|nr:hypothetical protein J6590_092423 [Homalodisca vitripennis]
MNISDDSSVNFLFDILGSDVSLNAEGAFFVYEGTSRDHNLLREVIRDRNVQNRDRDAAFYKIATLLYYKKPRMSEIEEKAGRRSVSDRFHCLSEAPHKRGLTAHLPAVDPHSAFQKQLNHLKTEQHPVVYTLHVSICLGLTQVINKYYSHPSQTCRRPAFRLSETTKSPQDRTVSSSLHSTRFHLSGANTGHNKYYSHPSQTCRRPAFRLSETTKSPQERTASSSLHSTFSALFRP